MSQKTDEQSRQITSYGINTFIRLGMPKWMLDQVREIAGPMKVCEFIRNAIQEKLRSAKS